MSVHIKLFASLKDTLNCGSLSIDISTPTTVKDLVMQISELHPEIERFEKILSYAINGEYASSTSLVKEGDEVAFLPPISGG